MTGKCYVIVVDAIQIGELRLRLAGIDAPELDHPWGQKAKWELVRLCKRAVKIAELEQDISYERLVATCYLLPGRDPSAEMVRPGFALNRLKVSSGKYSHLAAEGVRQKTGTGRPVSEGTCLY